MDDMINEGVVILKFGAVWCSPCMKLDEIMENVEKTVEGKAKIIKINIDEDKNTPQIYNVDSIPTLIILRNGQEIKRFKGVRTKEEIVKIVEEVYRGAYGG